MFNEIDLINYIFLEIELKSLLKSIRFNENSFEKVEIELKYR